MGAGQGKTRRVQTSLSDLEEMLSSPRLESEKLFVGVAPGTAGFIALANICDRYQRNVVDLYNKFRSASRPLIEKAWHEVPPEKLSQTFPVLNEFENHDLETVLHSYCTRWNFQNQEVFYSTLSDDINNSMNFYGHLEEFVKERLQVLRSWENVPGVEDINTENLDEPVF